MIDFLSEMGCLSLTRMDSGKWWARLRFPTPKGITAEADTDFQPTYDDALRQLVERVMDLRMTIIDSRGLPPR